MGSMKNRLAGNLNSWITDGLHQSLDVAQSPQRSLSHTFCTRRPDIMFQSFTDPLQPTRTFNSELAAPTGGKTCCDES